MADNQITPEEYVTWLTPRDAVNLVGQDMQNWDIAAETILRRVDAGLIRAHFKTGTVLESGKIDKLKDFFVVPGGVKKAWADSSVPYTLPFWTSGDAEVHLKLRQAGTYDRTQIWTLFGIRFDPAGINDLLNKPAKLPEPYPSSPSLTPPSPSPETPKHAGGAPRKEFWDDLWLAMFKRLWVENWQPKNQAEVEKAMLDWAAENGKDLGPTSVKTPAKKLFLLTKE